MRKTGVKILIFTLNSNLLSDKIIIHKYQDSHLILPKVGKIKVSEYSALPLEELIAF